MTFDALFRALIADPLEAVIGKPFLHVGYWLVDYDKLEFCLEAPNLTGLSAIDMVFADRTLEIACNWENELRVTNAYHIEARIIFEGERTSELADAQSLVRIGADQTSQWSNALTNPLVSVEVYGFRSSPQAIRFVFPSERLVLAIGSSGEQSLIGDGEEILVLSDDQWHKLERFPVEGWTKLWEY